MNGGQSVHDNAGLGRGLDNLEMDHNTYTHRIDDYTRNSLNSFSFGNAKLATAAGEDDEEGENISPTTTTIDVTPRPSVVSQTDFAPYAGSSRLSTSSRLSPTPSPSSFVSEADTRASHLHEVEFSSDDDSYEFDHLEYPEDDENIEISSARFSVGTGYISNGYGPPGGYRDREGSIATLKTLRRATSNSLVDTNGQPSMFTSPFESSSPVTETVLAAAPTSSTSPTDATDTDFDLAYITSFGADISPDFVRRPSAISISAPNRDQSHTPRKNSLGNSLFLSWFTGRRPSTATVASSNSTSNMFIHDDSFAEGLLKWGGDVYREQRKYWTFRREAHSDVKGKEVAIPSPKSPEVKEEPVRVRTSSSTSRATPAIPTTSTATDTDDSSRESNHTTSQKEREKERLRRATLHWRGMTVGSEETWSNGLLGDWNVQREDVGRNGKNGRDGDSSKGPQQRLLIRFRGDSMQNTEISPKADADHLQLPHPPITVHKHSKAMAFSLTRFYKTHSNYTSPSVHGGRPSTSSAGPVPPHLPPHFSAGGASSVSRTAGSKVILLAPRRVQEAFTSTTTTKMLAEHGLLGNGSGDVEKEARRRKSVGGEGSTSTPSSPNKVRRKMSLGGPVSQVSSGSPEIPPVPPLPSPSTSVSPHAHSPVHSPSDTSSPPIPTPLTVSELSYPGPPTQPETMSNPTSNATTPTATSSPSSPAPRIPPYTSESMLVSHRTSSYTENTENTDRSSTLIDSEMSETSASDASSASDATSASSHPSPSAHRRRGRRWYNGRNGYHNENETDESSFNEDDDELEHFRIIRTPHSEAYGTVDVSVLDRQRVLQYMSESSISSSTSSTSPFSLLERLINRNGIRSGVVDTLDPSASALRATAGPAFDPPWLTFPSRGKQEQQRRVVSNLNTSFKDVGLLPSSPRVPSHGRRGSRVGADSGASKSSSSGGSAGGRRKSVGGKGSKSGRKAASDPSKDVFSSVPPESLCMLLPLWPGDTDPPSHRGTHDYPPTRKMHIPPERKTFLLVWYKALDPQVEKEKGKRDNAKSNDDVALAVIDTLIGFPPKDEKEAHDRKEKDKKDKKDKKNKVKGVSSGSGRESGRESGKSSHGSPTSSNDGSGFLRSSRSLGSGLGRSGGTGTNSATQSGSHSVSNLTWAQVHANDDRNILLPGFLITARQVSYRDLQGTGVRVPDEGLTVNGPMDEAWREYNAGGFIDPGTPGISSFMPDPTIIAVCHSRESGVEFDPEALVSLGLCKVLNPLPMGMVAEDFAEENADGAHAGTDDQGPKSSWGPGAGLKLKLTPVGRSVMELCWVGGLSLMSFGPS